MKLIRLAALLCTAQLIGFSAASAQGPEKLQVHGYLTQGFARSDSLSVLGISDNATADYRTAALQLRYAFSSDNGLVLQVSHRRMGTSAMVPDGDIKLDWAFYQHRFGPVSTRIGRFPVASGLYNEVRDVGILMPFYRAPSSVYEEGFETADGAIVSAGTSFGAWYVDASVYGGGVDYAGQRVMPDMVVAYQERIERFFGSQLWLNTPVNGVRFGVAGMLFPLDASLFVPGMGEQDGRQVVVSGEAARDRFELRSEAKFLEIDQLVKTRSWYAQGGVRPWGGLWLNAQYEQLATAPVADDDAGYDETVRDIALGARYAVSPNVVLKIEGHDRKGYDFDTWVDQAGPAGEGRYWITSISVAF